MWGSSHPFESISAQPGKKPGDICGLDKWHTKQGAMAASDRLGVKRVNTWPNQNDSGSADGIGGPKEHAQISWHLWPL
jgi:hypothetical protein